MGAGEGGEVLVRTTEAITLRDGSRITADVLGSGPGGDLTLNTGRLTVQDGARVSATTFGTGAGGTLSVTADVVEVIGESTDGWFPSALFTQTMGDGDAGSLTIDTRRLTVQDGAQVLAGTRGTGQGGALAVNASESVELIGESVNGQNASGLFNQTSGAGDTGDLTIAAERLTVQDGASVSTTTSSAGQGGAVTVIASESVELTGTRADGLRGSILTTSANIGSTGDAGNLTLETQRLIIRDGSRIQTGTFSRGRGGALTVSAIESVELSGTSVDSQLASGIITSVQQGATGAGGNLTLDTRRLIIRDGAAVSTGTLGEGASGPLAVNASETVKLIGTSVDGQSVSRLSARTLGTGDAGDLTVTTGQLSVQDGAGVIVSSEGAGDAGNLDVAARSIRLDKEAFLSSNTAAGQGNIFLDSQDLVLRRGSNITTNATGTATGGNISIDTDILAALENSDISANALEGPGGQITINAQGIFGTEFRDRWTSESDITATSELGPEFSGAVELNTPDIDPSEGVVNLPEEVVDVSELVAQRCPAGGGDVARESSEFVVTGRGGLPPSPSDLLSSDAVLADWITLNPELEESRSGPTPATNPTNQTPAPLVEAQGWVKNSKGQVALTAQAPMATSRSPGLTPPSCDGS